MPVKARKNSVAHRYFNYLMIRKGDTVCIRKRPEGDIWALLYEFPFVESHGPLTLDELLINPQFKELIGAIAYTVRADSQEFRHQLSHQLIHARFVEIETTDGIKNKDFLKVNSEQLDNFALPRLIEKFLESLDKR